VAGYEAAIGRLPAGVALSNGRGIHDPAVAEWVLAVTLATRRSLPELAALQDSHTWSPWFSGSLFDATVLIVGYGSIGHTVERLMSPFSPTILRVSKSPHDGTSPVSDLPQLIGLADVVVVLLPDTLDTRGLFDREMMARMKDGALLVNAGRGSAVSVDALVDELQSGRIRAALDVTEAEPLPAGSELWDAPGVIITPHIASNASGKDERIARFIVSQLRRLSTGEPLQNLVAP
jgi:phosphoglycerate dehydrogenase-like enzyme